MKPEEEALRSARARLEQVNAMQQENERFSQREAETGQWIPNFVLQSAEHPVPIDCMTETD